MRRREFITLLGGAAAAAAPAPLKAQAPVVDIDLVSDPRPGQSPPVVAFFDELRLNGFVEGQNLEVIPDGFDVRNEQVAELSAALFRALTPDVIVSGGARHRAVQQATRRAIPHPAHTEDMVG